jgi:hypothetical protein
MRRTIGVPLAGVTFATALFITVFILATLVV